MTKNCPYTYRHKCKLYGRLEMGNMLIDAMKEQDLEIVCDRHVLINESPYDDAKRQKLSGVLIQELKRENSHDRDMIFNELLIEIKADDLEYLCSSLELTRSTCSMKKPVKNDLKRLLMAHINEIPTSVTSTDGKDIKYSHDLRKAVSVKSAFVQSENIKHLLSVFSKYGKQNGDIIHKQECNEMIFMYDNADSALFAYKSIPEIPELYGAVVELFTENEAIARKNTTLTSSLGKHNQRDPKNCLYIQGFVGSVTQDRIRDDLFGDFGEITDIWVSSLKKHCLIYFKDEVDAKDAELYCDDLKWPEDNGKRLKPKLMSRSHGKIKEETLKKLEDDLGGPRVDYRQISDRVERKQKEKYQFKVEQEKRIKAEQQLKLEREEAERERSLRLSMERKNYIEKRQAEEKMRAQIAIEERTHFRGDPQISSFLNDQDTGRLSVERKSRRSSDLQSFEDITGFNKSGFRRHSSHSDKVELNYLTPNTNHDRSSRAIDKSVASPFEQINSNVPTYGSNPIVDWFKAAVSELPKEGLDCISRRLIPGDHRHIGRAELVQMIEGSLNLAIISFKELLKSEGGNSARSNGDFLPYYIDRKRSLEDNEEYPKKRLSYGTEPSSRIDPVSNMEVLGVKNIVLVSNLDEKVDDTTWKLLFKEYGQIVRFWRSPKGKECIVKFTTLQDAQRLHKDLNEEYYRDYFTNELTHYKFSTRLVDEDYVISHIKKQTEEVEEAARFRKEEEDRLREENRRKEEEFIIAEERRRMLNEKILNERRIQEQEENDRRQEVERIKQEAYAENLEEKYHQKIEESGFGVRNLQKSRNRYTTAEVDDNESCLMIGIFNPPCKTFNDISHMFQGITFADYKFDPSYQNLFVQFKNPHDANMVYQKLNGLVWNYDTLHKIQANFISEQDGLSKIAEKCNYVKHDITESPHGYCIVSGLVKPIRSTKLNSFLMKNGGSNAYSNASNDILLSFPDVNDMSHLIQEFSGKKLEGTNEKTVASFRIISKEEYEEYKMDFKTVLFHI